MDRSPRDVLDLIADDIAYGISRAFSYARTLWYITMKIDSGLTACKDRAMGPEEAKELAKRVLEKLPRNKFYSWLLAVNLDEIAEDPRFRSIRGLQGPPRRAQETSPPQRIQAMQPPMARRRARSSPRGYRGAGTGSGAAEHEHSHSRGGGEQRWRSGQSSSSSDGSPRSSGCGVALPQALRDEHRYPDRAAPRNHQHSRYGR